MSKNTPKSSSIEKQPRIGLHSVIAFLAVTVLAAAVVILFPHFGIAGQTASGASPKPSLVPSPTPDASVSPEPVSAPPTAAPSASAAPVNTDDPAVYVSTSLIIDGEAFASLASREAAEELINTAVSHFELLCPGTGLVTEIENRIEFVDAKSGDTIISFDEAFASIIGDGSPLKVRTVFTRSDFETLPCASSTSESDEFYQGTRFVASYGRDGKKMQLHEYTYINGVLSALSLLEESVLTEPVNEQVLIGTRAIPADSTPARDFGFSDCPPTELSFAPPVDAPVSKLFGFHNGELNRGIDFDCAPGTVCIADCGGTVTAVLLRGSMGLTVELSHGGGFVTRYCGLQSADVSVGDPLLGGSIIGKAGEGGLHIEMLVNGRPRNPMYYFDFPQA